MWGECFENCSCCFVYSLSSCVWWYFHFFLEVFDALFFFLASNKYHSSSQYLASQRQTKYSTRTKKKTTESTADELNSTNNTNKYVSIYDNWFEKRTVYITKRWKPNQRRSNHKFIHGHHMNVERFDLKGGPLKCALDLFIKWKRFAKT